MSTAGSEPEAAPTSEPEPESQPLLEEAAEPVVELAPLLELRDGLPPVVDTPEALADYVARLRAGTGPVAIDAERASGFRYSARAYLIQLRREGSGTALVDPIAVPHLEPLAEALSDVEWIVHAASQDLACLAELGLRPSALFDTELAGRLLGYPRVGLATLVETVLGRRMRKEHSAADWSTRPLPTSWLVYAALDVEALIELWSALAEELEQTGKAEWARQEFEHLVGSVPHPPRNEPWRRTSGMHRARGRRALAAVRALWHARDAIASQRDVTPGRILPDSAIVAAAAALPRDRAGLLGVKGFRGRGAERYASHWVDALRAARSTSEDNLPTLTARYDGPPPARAWADRDPVAAARLSAARSSLGELADSLHLPVENLLTPDVLRRLLWEPPATHTGTPDDPPDDARDDARDDAQDDAADVVAAVAGRLADLGARPWQVELTATPIAEAMRAAPPTD